MQPRVSTSISDKRGTSLTVLVARLHTVRFPPDPRRPQGASHPPSHPGQTRSHPRGGLCAGLLLRCPLTPPCLCCNSPRSAERGGGEGGYLLLQAAVETGPSLLLSMVSHLPDSSSYCGLLPLACPVIACQTRYSKSPDPFTSPGPIIARIRQGGPGTNRHQSRVHPRNILSPRLHPNLLLFSSLSYTQVTAARARTKYHRPSG